MPSLPVNQTFPDFPPSKRMLFYIQRNIMNVFLHLQICIMYKFSAIFPWKLSSAQRIASCRKVRTRMIGRGRRICFLWYFHGFSKAFHVITQFPCLVLFEYLNLNIVFIFLFYYLFCRWFSTYFRQFLHFSFYSNLLVGRQFSSSNYL